MAGRNKILNDDNYISIVVDEASNGNLIYIPDERFPVETNLSKIIVYDNEKQRYDTVTLNYLRFCKNKYRKG